MASRKRAPVWKNILFWAAAVVVGMIGYAFNDRLGLTPGVWVLFLGLLMYVQYTQTLSNERTGFELLPTFDQMMETSSAEPVVPKHQRPQPLPASGWGINDEVRQFFEHFGAFADVANDYLKDTLWRLQEEADTDVATSSDSGPVIGRQYKLFHGPKLAGKITLSNGYQYSFESPTVHTKINVFLPRLYSASDISELVGRIISLTCSANLEEEQGGYGALQQAMIAATWQLGPEVVTNMDLDLHLNGSAERYLIRAGLQPGYA
jgi:hypothetical protein